jgi:hypothetical protein
LFQIDLLFASNTLWVWDTEKRFKELKLEHSELVHGVDHDQDSNGDSKEIENGGAESIEDVRKTRGV